MLMKTRCVFLSICFIYSPEKVLLLLPPQRPKMAGAPMQTSYLYYLPRDVHGLILPLLLYHPDADLLALGTALGPLYGSSRWQRALDERGHYFYTREWATNNHYASQYVRADGSLDYGQAVTKLERRWGAYQQILATRQAPGAEEETATPELSHVPAVTFDTSVFPFPAPTKWAAVPFVRTWCEAHRHHLDCFLTHLRAILAEAVSQVIEGRPSAPLWSLANLFTLPDVLAVPHPALETQTLRWFATRPHRGWGDIMLDNHRGRYTSLNWGFWTQLLLLLPAPCTMPPTAAQRMCGDILALPERWLRVYLCAAVQTDDITIFTETCHTLGYSLGDVRWLMSYMPADCEPLVDVVRYDAAVVTVALGLRDFIWSGHAVGNIMALRPRLRAVLRSWNYILHPQCLYAGWTASPTPTELWPFVNGMALDREPARVSSLPVGFMARSMWTTLFGANYPCDSQPALVKLTIPQVGPLVLVLAMSSRTSASTYLTVLRYLGRPLTVAETGLLLARLAATGTDCLTRFLLPLSAADKPHFQAIVRALDADWAQHVAPFATDCVDPKFLTLYRLALCYHTGTGTVPCRDFRHRRVKLRHNKNIQVVSPDGTRTPETRVPDSRHRLTHYRTRGDLTLYAWTARPYTRILALRGNTSVIGSTGTTVLPLCTVGGDCNLYVHLAAGQECLLYLHFETIVHLYKCDMSDPAWLSAALQQRYPEPA